MARIDLSDAIVKLDNASNTLTDVSGDISSLTLDYTVNGSNNYNLGSRFAFATEGGVTATITIGYYANSTASTLDDLVLAWALASTKGGARSIQIDEPDSEVGSRRYSCEVRLGGSQTAVTKTAGSGDPQTKTLTLNVDGTITVSTIS